jgi:hypothetical protein
MIEPLTHPTEGPDMTDSMTDDEFVAHIKANGFDTEADEERLTRIVKKDDNSVSYEDFMANPLTNHKLHAWATGHSDEKPTAEELKN